MVGMAEPWYVYSRGRTLRFVYTAQVWKLSLLHLCLINVRQNIFNSWYYPKWNLLNATITNVHNFQYFILVILISDELAQTTMITCDKHECHFVVFFLFFINLHLIWNIYLGWDTHNDEQIISKTVTTINITIISRLNLRSRLNGVE